MDWDAYKADKFRQAHECASMELAVMSAIVRSHLPSVAARVKHTAVSVADHSAAAKQDSEFLKQLAGAGF
jgi:hypothetical protein